QRGECGIDRPRLSTSPLRTSSRQPPRCLSARQPLVVSVSPRAVTYLGWPSASARPFRWQRSSAARAGTNGGRQRGTTLRAGGSGAGGGGERAKATEPGVPQPQLLLPSPLGGEGSGVRGGPGEFVDGDVPGDVRGARQEAGVVPAGGFDARCKVRRVAQEPDF